MIARAVLHTGLPPSVFGVEDSPELGAVILDELGRQAEKQASEDRMRALMSRF